MKKYVSIDIGGTAIKYGLIDEKANLIKKGKIDTEATKGGLAILDKVINIIKEFQKVEIISGVAISTAGIVDHESGEVLYLKTIPEYNGINYKKAIKEHFNLVCEVENDTNCAGLAEYISGASKNSKIAFMTTIGTGIGGSIIINGEIFHGFSNSAGEIAYMQINGENFQDIASTRALIAKVAQKKNENLENWNGIKIFEKAELGDKICSETVDEIINILAKGIANVCTVINPEIVVLGGGIMEREDYLKSKLEIAIKNYLIPPIEKHTTIKFATHKNDAGILGAFYNFCQKQKL